MFDPFPSGGSLVVQTMERRPDAATLLPTEAVHAAERAFDLGYHDGTDELRSALVAVAPLLRRAEIDDLDAEITRILADCPAAEREGLIRVSALLAGRRLQLEAY